MNPIDNPFNPGAGSPPPELAGRSTILQQAEYSIKRTLNQKLSKSQILLGLRGVGKTVLLNRINQIAEYEGCMTAIFEADPNQSLPELLTKQLHRLLLKLDRQKRVGDDIQKAFRMIRSFASAFNVKYGEFEIGISNKEFTGDLSVDLTDMLVAIGSSAKKRNTAVIILIDELQYLTQDDLSAFIVALHSISQRQLPLLFFGAGLPQIAKLTGEAKSYSERLFDFPEVDKLKPKSAMKALVNPVKRAGYMYDESALDHILKETDRYPFFLQLWGFHTWEVAKSSPFTEQDAIKATKRSIQSLDSGFYKIRKERLTERQLEYAYALATIEILPASSTQVANVLGVSVKKVAPVRDEIIKKGIAYSPQRGLISFTVPGFKEYLLRIRQ